MSFLRGSANYVWCTTSVLGKGATGAVFQGVNKHNGETVAVKTFNQLSHMRPQEVQMREFEVLRKVKHENIVKLLAIEEEQEGRGKVIVMELCTGGSLFNLLDDPENHYGLAEDEWILVLSHLSAGMNHLRDNNLVHRDLKPGNIMKFIKEDGTIIYKLTDFGAARELEDDQQFVSLYGTEEYLHPDMYERAVLRKPTPGGNTGGKSFGATVDLWSIGVTLYHVATGNLPFRPFGGRRNKETMYHITTKKASGVISGVQSTENGVIEWSTTLPQTCLLSSGIKKHITPLLAGLLEADPSRMWTFDKFFKQTIHILNKKKLHIFYANMFSELRVYLDTSEMRSVDCLKQELSEQTGLEIDQQIVIYEDSKMDSKISSVSNRSKNVPFAFDDDVDTQHNSSRSGAASNPIFLFSQPSSNSTPSNNTPTLLPHPPLDTFPSLPHGVNVESDASTAKSICAVGYSYRRRIEYQARASRLISKAILSFVKVAVNCELIRLYRIADKCRVVAQSVAESRDQLMEMFQSHFRLLNSPAFHVTTRSNKLSVNTTTVDPTLIKWQAEVKKQVFSETLGLEGRVNTDSNDSQADSNRIKFPCESSAQDLYLAVHQMFVRCISDAQLTEEWRRSAPFRVEESSAIKAKTHVQKLKESWQHLLRDRSSRTLTYNDEQFHILEKIKMQETVKVIQELYENHCVKEAFNQLIDFTSDWYKMAHTIHLQIDILEKDIVPCELDVEELATVKIPQAFKVYNSLLSEVFTSLDSSFMSLSSKCVQNGDQRSDRRTEQSAHSSATKSNSATNEVSVQVDTLSDTIANIESKYETKFKSILLSQEQVWDMIYENSKLMDHFASLAVSRRGQNTGGYSRGVTRNANNNIIPRDVRCSRMPEHILNHLSNNLAESCVMSSSMDDGSSAASSLVSTVSDDHLSSHGSSSSSSSSSSYCERNKDSASVMEQHRHYGFQ